MAYVSITVEGGMFPPDLLDQIATGDVEWQRETDFGLSAGQRLSTEMQSAFSDIRKLWDAFQSRLGYSHESHTTLTREYWMRPLLERLGYDNPPDTVVFQRSSLEAGGETYPISHRAGEDPHAPPIHVVAAGQKLDTRADGSRRSPHALVQEYLNRSEALWGIVTNGEQLRLLRDTNTISKPTYLELDLRGMVEQNLYSEFVLLYRLLHRSRLPRNGDDAHECRLERYWDLGIDQGGRVREHLRDGVERALRELGTAFLAHPQSEELREAIRSGRLDAPGYYRELLRLVYRFLFLMVVEERQLLFLPDAENVERQSVYGEHYSISRLRQRAEQPASDDGYGDLWEGLEQTFFLFRTEGEEYARRIGLTPLNGELFGPLACQHLESAACHNLPLLRALFQLSTFRDERGVRRRVNYAGLDVEELGSVYESLLDFHPHIALEPQPLFDLVTGSERKQTGSYYTPPSLVRELIESALVPVMEDRLSQPSTREEKEAALLGLRVVDPASGSGHFLLAAARRIARELAKVRTGEGEPAPEAYRAALRDVIRSCIYAVDKNPLAVDLCKVALWIEGYNAGMPLSFLDNHIKCGDSLVGVMDLDVLADGIPDDAYVAVTGDDKKVASEYRKRNKREREGQLGLWSAPPADLGKLAERFRQLGLAEERTPYEVHAKERAYEQLRRGGAWWDRRVACDLWTAAFFLPLRRSGGWADEVPTTDTVRSYLAQPRAANAQLVGKAVDLSGKHSFFHWQLEFPDVFARGGFDVVLGNPPWERIKLQEQEFFAARDATVAAAANAAVRKRLIAALRESNPALHREYEIALHGAEAQSKLLRGSGRYGRTGKGDINLYSVFAETDRTLLGRGGRAGVILPTGIATDDTNKEFFGDLVGKRALASLYDFENRKAIFSGVHRSYKFSLVTMASDGTGLVQTDFACFLLETGELRDGEKHFGLSREDFALINPNTRTMPIFRSKRDAELTKAIYRRVPVLIKEGPPEENPWGISFLRMFDMSNDSHLFRTHEELEVAGWQREGNAFIRGDQRYLPLYEAKMLHQFDHRWATYEGVESRDMTLAEKADPNCVALPRYWVPESEVETRLGGRCWAHLSSHDARS